MTALDRLIKAECVRGGVIHTYNRAFGRDVTEYEAADFSDLARDMLAAGKPALAQLASRASIAHLEIKTFA